MPPQSKPPLIQYWHESQPPAYIAELLETFAAHNPEMEHMVFDRAAAEDLIEAHRGERGVAAFRACAIPTMQADYFRYCAGHALGGICVDADCRCLHGLLPWVDGPAAGILFRATDLVLANGLFAFRSPGHPLLELAMEIATESIERRFESKPTIVTGPGVLTSLHCIALAGSLDAALDYVERGVDLPPAAAGQPSPLPQLDNLLGAGRKRTREMIGIACATIGSDARLAKAFDDVRILAAPVGERWIEHVDAMPYKSTKAHWTSAEAALYTEP